jgi:hypothetical protein
MLSETEAGAVAIKETEYCYVLNCAWDGEENNSICLERIFTKGGCEEIRLAWWNNGNQTMRPADLNADKWVSLFTKAIREGVFTAEEQLGMIRALLS